MIDWEYYKERLGNAIQKIITIPAAFQHVSNPVPRVRHPDWLHRRVREREDRFQQTKLQDMFARQAKKAQEDQAAAVKNDDDDDEEAEAGGSPGGRDAALEAADADMEDLGTSFGAAKKLLARTVRDISQGTQEAAAEMVARAEQQGRETLEVVAEDASPCPPRQEDFKGWLAHQKRRWQQQREDRKRRRVEERAAAARPQQAQQQPAGPITTVGAFFRHQQQQAAQSHWQLIQVSEVPLEPGRFKAWVLVDDRMYSVRLEVPRALYINSTAAPQEAADLFGLPVRRVQRELPGGQEPANVYEATLPEHDYLRKASEIAQRLAVPHVRGVFESRLPLGMEAAWRLGCVATLSPSARGKGLGEAFTLHDLQMGTAAADARYLEGARLQQLSLYHTMDEVAGRGILACVVWPQERAWVVMINSNVRTAQEVTTGLMDRTWRELDRQVREQADAMEAGALPQLSFEVSYVPDFGRACKSVQKVLATYREQNKGPTLVLSEGPRSSLQLKGDLPLLDAFPCVDIPANTADGDLPALGWQQRAARLAAARAVSGRQWLEERLEVARYGHLPVGNLGGDWLLSTMDAFFARSLRDQGHLLWAEDRRLPTLKSTFDPIELFSGEERTIEVNCRGAYRAVCVELKIHHLAVNALDKAGLLGDLEGVALVDEGSTVGPAFRVLRGMVQRLLEDATRRSNLLADSLLKNLYRRDGPGVWAST